MVREVHSHSRTHLHAVLTYPPPPAALAVAARGHHPAQDDRWCHHAWEGVHLQDGGGELGGGGEDLRGGG